MPERRESRVTFNLEPSFLALLEQEAREVGVPVSIYVRKIIIERLKQSGKITETLLFRMATTDSMLDIERLAKSS